MDWISPSDADALLDCLRRVYVRCNREGFPHQLLRTAGGLVGSDFVTYDELRPPDGPVVDVASPASDFIEEMRPVFERHQMQHPFVEPFLHRRDGRARLVSDYVSKAQWHDLALYQEFCKPMEIEDELAIMLRPADPIMLTLSFNRDRRNFTERDRRVMDIIRPHVIQAHRNAEAVSRLEEDAAWTAGALEASEKGAIALDSELKPVRWTEGARRRLAEYFPTHRRAPQRLPDDLTRWARREVERLLAGGGMDAAQQPLTVDREVGRLTARLVPDPVWDGYLLLLEERRRAPASAASLESLGLSRREAQVLFHVARGLTNAQAAEALHISPRTVGKHLQNLFSKLGVTTRAGAVNRAAAVMHGSA